MVYYLLGITKAHSAKYSSERSPDPTRISDSQLVMLSTSQEEPLVSSKHSKSSTDSKIILTYHISSNGKENSIEKVYEISNQE